jgi:DNA-directed RNA polymerase specialized sigma24 family protein
LNLTNLTKNGLELLLARLDPAADKATEKYEDLRLRLVKYFVWSCGCPESRADDLADQTLDRVATKLEQQTPVENPRAYSLATARFIWLEHTREVREDGWGDQQPDIPAETPEETEPDERYSCLEGCMEDAIRNPSDRKLILDYYDAEGGEKNKDHRRKLARRIGIEVGALKVRACRLRKSLEKCVRECLEEKGRL